MDALYFPHRHATDIARADIMQATHLPKKVGTSG